MADQQATDFEIGWLAGIADGEGYIGFSVTYAKSNAKEPRGPLVNVKPEFRIINTDPAIIDKAVEIMRIIGVNPYRRTQKPLPNRRVPHECSCKHMVGVEKILLAIHENLTGNKQERSAIILEFIAMRRENPGIPNPVYAGGVRGRHGPRTIRPYTEQEMALIEACRALQCAGASETIRETRGKAVQDVRNYAAKAWAAHDARLSGKIESGPQGNLFGDKPT